MSSFPLYAKVIMEGFSETSDYGVLRTQMDGGIAKQRARWTKPVVTRDVQILCSSVSLKISFDDWIRNDLQGGVSWFDFTDPVSNQVKQARIVDGKVSWSSLGMVWVAKCQLETIG